jgi:predicted DNA binding CopG/RHH family protein
MSIEELRNDLQAHGHRIVPNTMSEDELEDMERELDETVGIDDERMAQLATRAKSALSNGRNRLRMVSLRLDDETIRKMKAKAEELGMPYQTIARNVLKAAFA